MEPPENWPEGYGRRVLGSVDSTNAEAARRAPELSGPEWILALEQTAARGRRGRAWANPPGNFAATLVMRPTESPDRVALRSFVAALALHDALVAATGRAQGLALKWPNDVLLNGGKLAGILLESAGRGSALSHFAIGVGVNLADAPAAGALEPGAARPVSLLSRRPASPSRRRRFSICSRLPMRGRGAVRDLRVRADSRRMACARGETGRNHRGAHHARDP